MAEQDDDLVEGLLREEKKRQRVVLLVTVVVLAVLAAGIGWLATSGSGLLGPRLDVEGGEAELAALSNDPVCLGILAGVAELTGDWSEREGAMEAGVLGDDEEAVEQVRETATAFRSRLAALAEDVDEAVLRDPGAPEQMRRWFENQDNEFRWLGELADRRLQELRGEEVEERGGMWAEPGDLRDRLMLTIDDNFQEFRVWVASTGYPCGAAPEGDGEES